MSSKLKKNFYLIRFIFVIFLVLAQLKCGHSTKNEDEEYDRMMINSAKDGDNNVQLAEGTVIKLGQSTRRRNENMQQTKNHTFATTRKTNLRQRRESTIQTVTSLNNENTQTPSRHRGLHNETTTSVVDLEMRTAVLVLVETIQNSSYIYERIFGDSTSLKSQLFGCSNSRLILIPHPDIPILELTVSPSLVAKNNNNNTITQQTTKKRQHISNYNFAELFAELVIDIRQIFNITHPGHTINEVADHWIFVLSDNIYHPPNQVTWSAVRGSHFGFLESWIDYPQAAMHGFGHNLGFGHAYENFRELEDKSTAMGGPIRAVKVCYNGANMWHMGWFGQYGHYEIRTVLAPDSIKFVDLAFYGDYNKTTTIISQQQQQQQQPVLIKIGSNHYIYFNRRLGINADTIKHVNSILIVEERMGNWQIPYTNLIKSIPMNSNGAEAYTIQDVIMEDDDVSSVQTTIQTTVVVSVCKYSKGDETKPELVTLAISKNQLNGCSQLHNNGAGGGNKGGGGGVIGKGGYDLRIDVTYDAHPAETSWMLIDMETRKMVHLSPYNSVQLSDLPQSSTSPTNTNNNDGNNEVSSSMISTRLNNLPAGSYWFLLLDSESDGICCDDGIGYVTISEIQRQLDDHSNNRNEQDLHQTTTTSTNTNNSSRSNSNMIVYLPGTFGPVQESFFVLGQSKLIPIGKKPFNSRYDEDLKLPPKGTPTTPPPPFADGILGSDGLIEVKVQIRYDEYPTETSWMIVHVNSGTIVHLSPYNSVQVPGVVIETPLQVNSGLYWFLILDLQSDGICCDYGKGWVNIDQTTTATTNTTGSSSSSKNNITTTVNNNNNASFSAWTNSPTSSRSSTVNIRHVPGNFKRRKEFFFIVSRWKKQKRDE